MKKYELTEEHRAMLPAWRDKWIANAMSTKAMDDNDRDIMRVAIKGLYESAGLVAPPENRIVFVPSPFVARFAGGFAAAIWWKRKGGNKNLSDATRAATRDATCAATYDATRDATIDATIAATDAATYAATYAATRAATYDATDDATRDATRAATRDATIDATRAATYDATDDATRAATIAATRAATYDATRAATYDATYDATDDATSDATRAATRDATIDATRAATIAATYDATRAATYDATRAATYDATDAATDAAAYDATYDARSKKFNAKAWYRLDIRSLVKVSDDLKIGDFGLKCAHEASRMYQGGNFWSAWDGMPTFFRHVAKIDIDYSKYDHWEKAAEHGSYRIMHPDFCIVSDRPLKLTVDDQNRPHSFDGPYCEWRDGSALYAIHGVRVPMWICETPRNKFTKEMILSEENVDSRRCIIQKIGIEKAIELLGADVVDSEDLAVGGKYELLMIDYDNRGEKRPYLKMWNSSIAAHHIEGVAAGTSDVKAAICFRNKLKKFVPPQFLS